MSRRVVREVSRRVVSERVIGSANPIAKWGRESQSSCMSAFSGFFLGLLLFFATFALPYCAARTEKDSKDVSKLTVITTEQAATYSGKALVQGVLQSDGTIHAPKGDASGILAYNYIVEDLVTKPEKHNETHKEVQNGKEVEVTEEVTEMVEEWQTTHQDEQWQTLRLGNLTIDRTLAQIDLPWNDAYNVTSPNQKHRETVKVVKGGMNVLLACELKDGVLVDIPDFYILTSKAKDELVSKMNAGEETNRWLLIGASILLWTISLTLLVGPLMLLVNIVPIKALGALARGAVTFVSFLIACLITWITYVAVRYWWAIVVLLAILAVWSLVAVNRHRQANPQLDVEPPDTPKV
jgi:hypothetical protein